MGRPRPRGPSAIGSYIEHSQVVHDFIAAGKKGGQVIDERSFNPNDVPASMGKLALAYRDLELGITKAEQVAITRVEFISVGKFGEAGEVGWDQKTPEEARKKSQVIYSVANLSRGLTKEFKEKAPAQKIEKLFEGKPIVQASLGQATVPREAYSIHTAFVWDVESNTKGMSVTFKNGIKEIWSDLSQKTVVEKVFDFPK